LLYSRGEIVKEPALLGHIELYLDGHVGGEFECSDFGGA